MHKNLSDNLNILMAKARLTSSDLARLTGLPATTIKRIRSSEQSNPTISTLLPIAKYFSLSISELIGNEIDDIDRFSNKAGGLRTLPVLSWQTCVHFDAITYSEITDKTLTEKQVGDKSFSLIVEDQDITPFPHKSTLIIDPQVQPANGDYIIVSKFQRGAAAIKKYIVEMDQIYLKSLIDGLGVELLTDEYKILGVVVQYKFDFKNH